MILQKSSSFTKILFKRKGWLSFENSQVSGGGHRLNRPVWREKELQLLSLGQGYQTQFH